MASSTSYRYTVGLVSYGRYKSKEDGVHVAQLLLDRGVDVNIRRKDYRTPLHVASYYGKLEIVQLLLANGAKVDGVDNIGETPLHRLSKGKYESEEDGVSVARLFWTTARMLTLRPSLA